MEKTGSIPSEWKNISEEKNIETNRLQPEWSLPLKLFHDAYLATSSEPETDEPLRVEVKEYCTANLISSELKIQPGLHLPLLDIDFRCHLIPSSTQDHFHLIFDKILTQEDYTKLLTTLHEVGIIEDGVYQRFLREGRTYLRRPGDKK